jgi:hypothetical protein
MEALKCIASDVVDPMREILEAWQPNARGTALQRQLIDEMAVLPS